MKNTLIIFLLFHVIVVVTVNLFSFKNFSPSKTAKLNYVGQQYITNFQPTDPVEPIKSIVGFYANITGTNRGYEFFSPNVSSGAIQLRFEKENCEEIQLLETSESSVKMVVATIYYFKKIKNEEAKNAITKSICKRIFEKNQDINTIKVYLKMRNVNPILSYTSESEFLEKELLISTVKKHKNEI